MLVHPDTKTLLFRMRFIIFSDIFTLVCLFIFIIWMFVWNSLLSSLHSADLSTERFRRALKTFLFVWDRGATVTFCLRRAGYKFSGIHTYIHTNPASWLPESNKCYVMCDAGLSDSVPMSRHCRYQETHSCVTQRYVVLCAMQVCQIVFLCLGTVVIKKLTAVLLNVTDDVSYYHVVAIRCDTLRYAGKWVSTHITVHTAVLESQQAGGLA